MNVPLFPFVRQAADSLCQAHRQHLHRWTKAWQSRPVLNAVLDLTHSGTEPVVANALLRQQTVDQAIHLSELPHWHVGRFTLRDPSASCWLLLCDPVP